MSSPDKGSLQIPLENQWDKAQHLRHVLQSAIDRSPADVLLLSGGVDSAMLGALDLTIPAITVVLEGKGDDLINAQKVAERFNIPWYHIEISEEQAMQYMREVMQLTNSYDLAIKNDITIYAGLKYAASLGYTRIRTGDAADEWFAGYAYLHQREINLTNWINYLRSTISLPSSRMGKEMGLQMSYPYLDPEVIDLALSFERSDVIKRPKPDQDLGPGDYSQQFRPKLRRIKSWGKIPLRDAGLYLLPSQISWKQKKPIEYGSGTNYLEEAITDSVTQDEIKQMRQSGKHFWNIAHGKLYLIFRELGLSPKSPAEGEYGCHWCGGGTSSAHCHTCGAYPADQPMKKVFESAPKT